MNVELLLYEVLLLGLRVAIPGLFRDQVLPEHRIPSDAVDALDRIAARRLVPLGFELPSLVCDPLSVVVTAMITVQERMMPFALDMQSRAHDLLRMSLLHVLILDTRDLFLFGDGGSLVQTIKRTKIEEEDVFWEYSVNITHCLWRDYLEDRRPARRSGRRWNALRGGWICIDNP